MNNSYMGKQAIFLPVVRILCVASLLLGGCISSVTDTASQTNNTFQDCVACPVMLELPPGSFVMGTAAADRLIDPRTGQPATNDGPQHRVTISQAFAIGRYEVTAGQFGDFVAATGYQPQGPCMEFSSTDTFTISAQTTWNDTGYPQTDNMPVVCVSFFDAQAYTDWLSRVTGENYRLPSEAEWEYAARAGTTTPYFWGNDPGQACNYANIRSPGAATISERQAQSDTDDGYPCDDGYPDASPVGSFAPNAFGLADMQGNAWEWVSDCNHKDYADAPTDGSAWLDAKGCQFGVIRSGSFLNRVERSSTTVRAGRPREGRATNMGFRVVRSQLSNPSSRSAAAAADWQPVADSNATDPGAVLFNSNCAACHVKRDDFRGVYGTDQASLESTIRDGGNNIMSMPAFGNTLTSAEISALALYIRQQNSWQD